MKSKKKKGGADFRYDTGPSRIPWSAVGEPVREEDLLELVRFLLPPAADITKHLTLSASCVIVQPDGLQFISHSPARAKAKTQP